MITPGMLLFVLLLLSATAYYLGRRRSVAVAGGMSKIHQLHSRPTYYGMLTALWCGLPALIIFSCWQAFEGNIITHIVVTGLPPELASLPADRINLMVNDIRNLVSGNIVSGQMSADMQAAADHYRSLQYTSTAALAVVVLAVAIAGLFLVRGRISGKMRARNHVERLVQGLLVACSTVAIFTTIGIVLSVLYEAIRFFQAISIWEFLFGLEWSPQMAIRADQVGSSGAFGAIPVLVGTLLISAIAMAVAVPIGLMSAIYLSEYAGKKFRDAAKPLMEILAGIPTVVYGFFAALTVAPRP
jgi:phosphate transport system permease protein